MTARGALIRAGAIGLTLAALQWGAEAQPGPPKPEARHQSLLEQILSTLQDHERRSPGSLRGRRCRRRRGTTPRAGRSRRRRGR